MTQPQQQPVDPRQAILRRLSVAGQKSFGNSDPKVAAFQYAHGLPATGVVDSGTMSAGWTAGGAEVDPAATNPYVQAYGQYAMNDYNNGYGGQTMTPEQIRQLQMMKAAQR